MNFLQDARELVSLSVQHCVSNYPFLTILVVGILVGLSVWLHVFFYRWHKWIFPTLAWHQRCYIANSHIGAYRIHLYWIAISCLHRWLPSSIKAYVLGYIIAIVPVQSDVETFLQIPRIAAAAKEIGMTHLNEWIGNHAKFRNELIRKGDIFAESLCPFTYIPGLSNDPFPARKLFSWAEKFEQKSFTAMRSEMDKVVDDGQLCPMSALETSVPVQFQHWRTIKLVDPSGARYEENITMLPETWKLIQSVPNIVLENCIMLSSLDPKSGIEPHTGISNMFIRCHFTLYHPEPERSFIRVGFDDASGWTEGKLLFLNDAHWHQVKNYSRYKRVVLFFDVWHPDFTEEELKQIKPLYSAYKSSEECQRLGAASQQIERDSLRTWRSKSS